MPPRSRFSLPMPQRVRFAMDEADYDRDGLLEGLDDDARRTRVSTLRTLAADGVDTDTMREAIAGGRLGLLLIERSLAPADGRTLAELCAAAELEPDVVRRWLQALGRPVAADPDAPVYTDEDLEIARRIPEFRSMGFSDAELMPVVRAVGRGVLNIADALGGLLGDALLTPGDPEAETALQWATAARRVAEEDALQLVHLVSVALAERIRTHALAAEGSRAGSLRGAQEVTVCFADLVGFTGLGETISAGELSEIAELLSATATEVVRRPVRLSKTIGDAVMLTSPDPRAMVEQSLELLAAWGAPHDGRPALRVGVASGIAVPHAGDWFGPPVNLASRVTETARPGQVTVTAEVRDAITGSTPGADGVALRFRPAAPRRFKGIRGAQRLFRVSGPPSPAAGPA